MARRRVQDTNIDEFKKLLSKYGTYAEVARQTGWSASTVSRYAKKIGATPQGRSNTEFESHREEALEALDNWKARALEIIGGKMESYAKMLCAPMGPKGNPFPTGLAAQIRNSIGHRVDGDTVFIYSNLDLAAYVELGTSREYSPPPEWIENKVEPGPHSGLEKWWFYDEAKGQFRIGLPLPAQPFMKPAVLDHKDEYKTIAMNELKKG